MPVEDENAGQIPVLYISVETDRGLFDKKSYNDYLKTKLDGNKTPKQINIISSIPRTNNGKIRRNELMGSIGK